MVEQTEIQQKKTSNTVCSVCSHDGMIHEMLCLASSSTNKGQFSLRVVTDQPTDWQKDTLIEMQRCEEKYYLGFLIDSMALLNLYLMKNINYHESLKCMD